MNNVNKTLYIPLYGKAYVSKKGIILNDKKAEEIWEAEGFALKGKSKSKWLAYYMGIRSATFDDWLKEKLTKFPNAMVIHLGCGLDSRVLRVDSQNLWYDIDFCTVIDERKKYYSESENYKMLSANLNNNDWLNCLYQSKSEAIVVMEGVSMYLTLENLRSLTGAIAKRFNKVCMIVDCYSELAAKLSKLKNPIHQVGVSKVYGLNDPTKLNNGEFVFNAKLEITPQRYIEQLVGVEKSIFKKLYAGNFSKKLYMLYQFEK